MKQKLFSIRARKRILCLLLMAAAVLQMTTPFAAAADANTSFNKQTFDQPFCEWKRVTKKSDLPASADRWHPVIIGFENNGTEYYLDASSVTGDKVLTDNWTIKAKKWSDMMAIYRCPSLNDERITSFVTLGTSVTDIAIRYLTADDEEKRGDPTYLIGRNINWDQNEQVKENAAKQVLTKYGRSSANFDTVGSTWYNNCKGQYPVSFNQWSFITSDGSGKDYYNWELNEDKLRIISIADRAWDDCFYYNGDSVCIGNFASSNYTNGTFTVWIGTVKNLPTLNGSYTVPPDQLLNLDNDVLLREGSTLKVSPGATLTIDTTLYNNGTIENYGTIFLLEGGTIRTLCPTEDGKASQNCGKILCSGSQRQGEGNLVAFKNSSIILDEGANLFRAEAGATVELNGTMVCPNSFTLDNADFRIREQGMLISQYAMPSGFLKIKNIVMSTGFPGKPSSFNMTSPKMKEMNKTAVPKPYYTNGSCQFIIKGYFICLTQP